jgi:hypothetical protein
MVFMVLFLLVVENFLHRALDMVLPLSEDVDDEKWRQCYSVQTALVNRYLQWLWPQVQETGTQEASIPTCWEQAC